MPKFRISLLFLIALIFTVGVLFSFSAQEVSANALLYCGEYTWIRKSTSPGQCGTVDEQNSYCSNLCISSGYPLGGYSNECHGDWECSSRCGSLGSCYIGGIQYRSCFPGCLENGDDTYIQCTCYTINAPAVTTDIASVNLQGETATLNGTLNGLGGASSCDVRFEYRKPGESGYPNVTPWQTISVDNTPFSATIGAPEGFTPQTVAGNTYVYRAVAQNTAGTSYGPTDKQVVIYTASGGQQSFTTLPSTYTLTVSKTGTGSGTVTDTGINCGTDCSEAYNLGTSVTLTATPDANSTFAGWSTSWACGNTVTFTYKGSPVTYGTVASQGKCWLDRNLGASQVATLYNDSNAYGDLFQWGRLGDGHQTRTSGTTTTLSITDTPVDSNFIYGMGSPYDWRSPQNDNLWQGVSGTNNPCPSGWRLPTSAELDTERASWSQQNYNGAFASPLKLTAAGYRNYSDASLGNVGSYGGYWSSTVDRTFGIGERITSSDISIQVFNRALGFSVRCLKDEIEECSGTGTCTLPMDSDKNVTATFNIACECTSNVSGGCCDGCHYCLSGTVFNGLSCADLSCTNYCGTAGNYCTVDRQKGEFRMACGETGSCNGTTLGCNNIQDCGVTSYSCWSKCRQDYTYTCSAGVCGTYHTYATASSGYRCDTGNLINTGSCAQSSWNACVNTGGSPYQCKRKADIFRCNGTGYNDTDCNSDIGDVEGNITSGYVCTGSGTETLGSNTYYSSLSVFNGCAGAGSPYSCQKKQDKLACDGAGGNTGPDVGDNVANVASGKVCENGNEVALSATRYCGYTDSNLNSCQWRRTYSSCNGSNVCSGATTYSDTTCGASQATKGAVSCSAVTTANYCDYACDGVCRIGYRGCSGSGTTCEATFRAFTNCAANTACSGSTCASGNYCAANQCRDGGGWYHKCSKWCDGNNGCNNWADATCVNHCTNGVKDCDETGIDTGGSCPVATCVIGGLTYNNGDYNPNNKCQICDVSKSTTSWSNVSDGTDLAGWCSPTWNSCDSACVKRGGDGNCYAGQCDTTHQVANITAGYVCSGGSEVVLSCTNYCGTAGNYCTVDRQKGEFRMACGETGSCNGTTLGCNNIQDCGVTSYSCWSKCRQDYTYTCSAGVCGTYHTYATASSGYRCDTGNLINTGSCAQSSWNACVNTGGSPYQCKRKADIFRCNGTGYNDTDCNSDIGDVEGNITSGYVCTGSGTETLGSNTYYSSLSVFNGCAGAGSPYSCQKKQDKLACDGAGGNTGPDVGDNVANVASGKVCENGNEVALSATRYCGYTDSNLNSCQWRRTYSSCNGSNVCSGATTYSDTTCGASQATKGAVSCSAVTTANYCDYACDGVCRIGYRGCSGSGTTCEATFRAFTNCAANTACSGSTCASGNYCAANQCRDGGGWYHKCSKWCDGNNGCNNWADATCVNHCTNGVKDCDETGIDTGGSCSAADTAPPTTGIKIKRTSTGEDLTAAGVWLRPDTYTIQFEDHDQAAGSGSNCENCSCEYSVYSCDAGGTNCNTQVVPLTSRTPNSSFDIVAGKTAPTYNLEGVGRYLIQSVAKDMANNSTTTYRGINLDFTPPRTEIK